MASISRSRRSCLCASPSIWETRLLFTAASSSFVATFLRMLSCMSFKSSFVANLFKSSFVAPFFSNVKTFSFKKLRESCMFSNTCPNFSWFIEVFRGSLLKTYLHLHDISYYRKFCSLWSNTTAFFIFSVDKLHFPLFPVILAMSRCPLRTPKRVPLHHPTHKSRQSRQVKGVEWAAHRGDPP